MPIHWMYAAASSSDGDASSALVDVVPTVLACLDWKSTMNLSSVSRDAARSHVRELALQRSVVQISASSFAAHAMLRRMAMRHCVHRVEIRDFTTAPRHDNDFKELLRDVKCVKFSREQSLDQEVREEVERMGGHGSQDARMMGDEGFARHVRRRMDAGRGGYCFGDECDSWPASEAAPWVQLLPATLLEIDWGTLRIEELLWLERFPVLKKLQFNASCDLPFEDMIKPLAKATTLEELSIVGLKETEMPELAALTLLRKLELRGASKLRSVDFLHTLVNLEHLVLGAVEFSDLSPLMGLHKLKELTLDSAGPLRLKSHNEKSTPAFPQLETLQIMFTAPPMRKLLHQCPNLVQLHLCEAKLADWAPLRKLRRLEQIAVNVDEIQDWSPLAELPKLKHVSFESRRGNISGKSFGAGWKALEDLISPPWDDYSSLAANATNLKSLHVLGWRSRDSSALEALKDARRLEMLRIAFVPGAIDLSSLSELRQLKALDLWCASVASIGFLREMKNLEELKMSSPFGAAAGIVDFKPLAALVKLKTLDLNGRREFKSAHLELLAQLPALVNLDVAGTGVSATKFQSLHSHYKMPLAQPMMDEKLMTTIFTMGMM